MRRIHSTMSNKLLIIDHNLQSAVHLSGEIFECPILELSNVFPFTIACIWLCRHLAVRYSKLHGTTDDNAFWPGHLLDKIQLYMPKREPFSNSVFTQVKPTKKAYPQQVNQPGGWKVSDFGYVQYGSLS